MARTIAWRSVAAAALLAVAGAGCGDETTAPGSCPDFCPTNGLTVVDTVINGVVAFDTSVRGYTRIDKSPVMVTSTLDSLTAFGIVRFQRVPQRWFPIPGDTTGVNIGTIDSVALEVRLELRDSAVDTTRILVFVLPKDRVDSNATYDSLVSFLQAAPIDSIPVADSVYTASLRRLLPVGPVTPLDADSFEVALGFGVRGESATVAILGASELGVSPILRYYVHGAAPRDTFSVVIPVGAAFDGYVRTPEAVSPPAGTIIVGNQPAARAFLRFDIPSYYVDSVAVIRATLQLRLTKPVLGFPGETYQIQALPILRYFGGKSIIFPDTTGVTGSGRVVDGDSVTADLEIGRILRLWRGIPPDSLPRAISLRSSAEAFTFAEIHTVGAGGGAAAPALHLSFVRPYRFGLP